MAKKKQAGAKQGFESNNAAPKPPTAEEQVVTLEARLSLGVGIFTITVARATGRVYTAAGGDWGEGSAGLLLMQQALESVLAQVRQAAADAQVQERVLKELKSKKEEASSA